MSRDINRVQIMGNVGVSPEVQTTRGGKKVAKFSVATSYGKGDKARTQWHRVTAWEKVADIVEQYVNKGDRIIVEGSIEYSTTEDENGKPRYWTDIIARDVYLIGGKAPAAAASPGRATPSPFDPDDDDLPF